MENKTIKRGGMGLISTLSVIFIVLKLFNLISWSWLWVLSFLWIPALLVFIAFSFIMVGGRIKKGKW